MDGDRSARAEEPHLAAADLVVAYDGAFFSFAEQVKAIRLPARVRLAASRQYKMGAVYTLRDAQFRLQHCNLEIERCRAFRSLRSETLLWQERRSSNSVK